jgi:hypothetical protein
MDKFMERKFIDSRTKLQFEDHIKNLVLHPQSSVTTTTTTTFIASGDAAANTQPTQPPTQQTTTVKTVVINETAGLTVSTLATEMGFKLTDAEGKAIGGIMAKKYKAKYNEKPSKHLQYVNGANRPVNSYMQRDKAMMEEAVHEVMAKRSSGAAAGSSSGRRDSQGQNAGTIYSHFVGGMQRADVSDEDSDSS